MNETYNVEGGGMESGEKVLPVALDWLKRNEGCGDWFLHVHFWDPHTPYRAPESFGDWIYIRTIHDGFHMFDDEMLFNIKNDPHEQHDLKEAHPELCAFGVYRRSGIS